ncbi:MAG: C40 family peptidase [Nocardioidaceae bacterium]
MPVSFLPATATLRRWCALVPLLLVAALALSMVQAPSADAFTQRERKVRHGLAVAKNQVGDPYRYGARGPNSFDCSGLTSFAYGHAGLYLPRSSDAQYRFVRHIQKRNIRRGDLMFFYSSGGVYHVGIFLGRDNGSAYILHASRPGTVVHRDRVWTTRWRAGTLRR